MTEETQRPRGVHPRQGARSRAIAGALALLILATALTSAIAQPVGRKRGFFSSLRQKNEPAAVPAQPAPLTWQHPAPREGLVVDAITFALDPGRIYVPLNDLAYHLGRGFRYDASRDAVRLPGRTLAGSSTRRLVDGTILVSIRDLEAAGVPVSRGSRRKTYNIGPVDRYFTAVVYGKRAEVDLAGQRLRAWQGNRQVLECRVSSGEKRGSTPTGSYSAGPYKKALHLSSLYDDAPMPFSVQVTGHVFIHGYSYVPNFPASHGCIRVPLGEGNPAKFFYEWVDKGTPVRIRYGSSKPALAARQPAPGAVRPPAPPLAPLSPPKARNPFFRPASKRGNESPPAANPAPGPQRQGLFNSTSRKKRGQTEFQKDPRAPSKPATPKSGATPAPKRRPAEKKLAANPPGREAPRSSGPVSIHYRSF